MVQMGVPFTWVQVEPELVVVYRLDPFDAKQVVVEGHDI